MAPLVCQIVELGSGLAMPLDWDPCCKIAGAYVWIAIVEVDLWPIGSFPMTLLDPRRLALCTKSGPLNLQT